MKSTLITVLLLLMQHLCCFPLTALQVAAQQGKYLAGVMNKHSEHFPAAANSTTTSTAASASAAAADELPAFRYTHLGSMASVGEWKGVVDTPNICKWRSFSVLG
jgi:NADH dehydrogenase FAD-containing subunit